MRAVSAGFLLCLAASVALAQGTIPGLTSTPITFSGHADDFTAGPDGNVWLVDSTANAIGRLAVDGSAYQAFPVPTAAAGLNSIVAGPDGNLWFTESLTLKVGRITTSGTISEFAIPPPFVYVLFGFVNGEGTIASGPDGNLWISGSGQMAKVTPQGAVTVLSVAPPAGGDLFEIGKCVAGPDANLWCLSNVRIAGSIDNHPAKLTTAGVATLYPGISSQDFDILKAPDGNLWISAQGAERTLMRITPAGVETVYALPTTRESRLAAGNDGNIWFTERTTSGNLWQLVLSTATDDGHATFNSTPISTSYPEGIIAIGSPPAASGTRTAQDAPGCPAGAAFVVGTSAEYGENLTWCKTGIDTECTDLIAVVISDRGSIFSDPNVEEITAQCFVNRDPVKSPNPAQEPVLTIDLPPFSTSKVISIGQWTDCNPQGSGTEKPQLTCTAKGRALNRGQSFVMQFTHDFIQGPAAFRCRSNTPETDPSNNDRFGLLSEALGLTLQPAPPVNASTRGAGH